MFSSVLSISDLSKSFEVEGARFVALASTGLELGRNEIVAVIGPSGCGKSTLLRCIAGLEHPDTGRIRIEGNDVTRPGQGSALVFQDHRLLPWLTVRANVELALEPLRLSRADQTRRAARYIELVGLSRFADSFPRQLSGGMAQRAALARALAVETGLVLMDEPFGALDSILRSRMQDELLKIWQEHQVSILIVTHDIEEALYLADRVVVMRPDPGHIQETVEIALPRPRQRDSAAFGALRSRLLAALAESAPGRRVA
ncbi:ABC transporter ATP-binding protein [Celeribacter indicus]|uniref:ABC transporter n=1 Tax=Celeribacter indicus TaxID=1208324 RepID=A0A0B5E3Z0_9RHOB|nr:ABC transporter ATP-binding protein [Celeribacter indicus]AJE47097.1 ABC transporter [Celeribacter indicus]SDW90976.1 NitT/TauT family transport system ATP-binding protein/sulfonate transport system ATP-binding protein [Celeribacter indicus]